MELENVLRARGLLTTDKNGELEFTTPPLPPGAGKKKKTKLDLLLTKPKKRKRDETIEDEAGQKHSTHSGALTEAEKDHMERCMEKKAKLYDDLKKGKVTDKDGRYHIDWDRKHAEAIERGENLTESDEEDDGPKDIKTIDEFGRTVWMSKKQHEKKIKLDEEQEKFWEEHSVIPVQPAKLIYGDTIQTAAFTADDASAKWDEVRKRNDELYKTSTFFDPKMIPRRSYGASFIHLSHDEEERRKQIEEIEQLSKETAKARRSTRVNNNANDFLTKLQRSFVDTDSNDSSEQKTAHHSHDAPSKDGSDIPTHENTKLS